MLVIRNNRASYPTSRVSYLFTVVSNFSFFILAFFQVLLCRSFIHQLIFPKLPIFMFLTDYKVSNLLALHKNRKNEDSQAVILNYKFYILMWIKSRDFLSIQIVFSAFSAPLREMF